MKVLALGAFFALAAPLATPVFSQTGVTVQIAPPAAQVETIPVSPGGGAVWTPGFYQFDPIQKTYIWQTGSYQMPPSRHMVWVAAHYINRDDGSYEFFSGHWATKHQAHEQREAELKMER
jgi:hypothetical protein